MRIIASLTALSYLFSTVVVSARPLSSLPTPPEEIQACAVSDELPRFHEAARRIGEQARDLGDAALRLRRTSRAFRYKQIERAWVEVRDDSEQMLDALAHLP